MLTVEHRLRRTSDFRSTVRGGVRAGRRLVVVYLLPSPSGSDGPTRAGFVVGRTVGPAVVRNTVRRRLRHLLRDRLDRLPKGSRIVVRALPAAAAAPSSALGRDLDAAIERAVSRLAGPS